MTSDVSCITATGRRRFQGGRHSAHRDGEPLRNLNRSEAIGHVVADGRDGEG